MSPLPFRLVLLRLLPRFTFCDTEAASSSSGPEGRTLGLKRSTRCLLFRSDVDKICATFTVKIYQDDFQASVISSVFIF